MRIVRDIRILKAMEKAGFLILPNPKFTYVDYSKNNPYGENFVYKFEKYGFQYFSGCFNPFIVKVQN